MNSLCLGCYSIDLVLFLLLHDTRLYILYLSKAHSKDKNRKQQRVILAKCEFYL